MSLIVAILWDKKNTSELSASRNEDQLLCSLGSQNERSWSCAKIKWQLQVAFIVCVILTWRGQVNPNKIRWCNNVAWFSLKLNGNDALCSLFSLCKKVIRIKKTMITGTKGDTPIVQLAPNLQNFYCKTVTRLLTRRTILLETSTHGMQTKMASLTFKR